MSFYKGLFSIEKCREVLDKPYEFSFMKNTLRSSFFLFYRLVKMFTRD